MTRINTIDPELLTDQHLIAEWRELPRVFPLAVAYLPRAHAALHAHLVGRATREPDIPPAYTLGAGHVRFFYPRTGYLSRRQAALIAECLSRGFAIRYTTAPEPIPGLDADWTPTDADHETNLGRLREKLAAKPGWYTYRGTKVGPDFYSRDVRTDQNRENPFPADETSSTSQRSPVASS